MVVNLTKRERLSATQRHPDYIREYAALREASENEQTTSQEAVHMFADLERKWAISLTALEAVSKIPDHPDCIRVVTSGAGVNKPIVCFTAGDAGQDVKS